MKDPEFRLKIETTSDSSSVYKYAGDIEVIYPSPKHDNSVVELRVGEYQLIVDIDKLSKAMEAVKAIRQVITPTDD
jgi:hypothetical protein